MKAEDKVHALKALVSTYFPQYLKEEFDFANKNRSESRQAFLYQMLGWTQI